MNNMIKTLLLLILTLSPWFAQAKIFMCKDATGRTITSDRPIPECADQPVKELDNSGVTRREIARPLTPEEKRQQRDVEEKRKADALAAEERAKEDRLLLARYSTEKDIEVARKRALESTRDQLKMEMVALATAENKRKLMRDELEAAKKRERGPSADLLRRVEESDQALAAEKKAVQEREKAILQIDIKYDETLKRYREVSGVTGVKTPAPPAAKTP
jgi:hypothetical protein